MSDAFTYGAAQSITEYQEMQDALKQYEDDPVAQLLVEQEASARMALGYQMDRLRDAATTLAERAQRIVTSVDRQGLDYRPNSLGEIQGHMVDIECAKVYGLRERLESTQKALRKHLDEQNTLDQ